MAKYRIPISFPIVLIVIFFSFVGFISAVTEQDEDTDYNDYDLTNVGNISGTDVDTDLGTGDLTTTGDGTVANLTASSQVKAEHVYSTDDLDVGDDATIAGDATVTGTVRGGTITDGTTTITGGNYTGVGNITGSDVDISAGTGDYTSTGFVRVTILQLISALYAIYEDSSDMFLNSPAILNAISLAQIEGVLNTYGLRYLYNGSARSPFNALVTSDGATVTLTVTNAAGGDLTMQFSDGDSTLTGGSTIVLTAGSDTSPTDNFIYVLQSDPTTLVKSTSAFPTTLEHNKIGYFLVPSAGFVQTNGVYINQNWNDAISGTDNQGHLLHMAERSRRLGAQYFSGVGGNGTDGYLTPTAGNVELKSTAGVIYQMHRQVVSAFDTYSNDLVLVANWSGDAFHDITNLYDITADSTGVTIGNNKFFNLVVWGVGNKTGEYGPMMINLPGGFYNKAQQAREDASGYDNFSMSREFSLESSTGFLIARITIQMKTGGGTWVVDSTTDLRGQTPATAAGGVGSIRDEFADNTFRIFDESDNAKEGAFDIGTGVTTGNTRTVQWPNVDTLMWADNGSVPLTANWDVGAFNITAQWIYSDDQVYGVEWNGELSVPTKNAVYDKVEVVNTAVGLNTAKVTNATHTGDVTGATALTIGADKILESMLKTVNAAVDEYALTYESTTGDFEWTELSSGTTVAAWQIWTATNEIYKIGVINGIYSSPYGDGYYFGGVEPAFGTAAQNVIAIEAGTAPTSSPANVVQLYSEAVLAAGTELLLHFNGTDGATTTTDSSGNSHPVTLVADAQIDTAQYKWTSSLLLDGTGDYAYVDDDSTWTVGTADYTFEAWMRFSSVAAPIGVCGQFIDGSNRWYMYWENGTSAINFVCRQSASNLWDLTFDWSPVINTWYHIAASRSSGALRMFIDGTSQSITETLGDGSEEMPDYAADLEIGNIDAGAGYASTAGWVDEFRWSSVAHFIANFTPPTEEYSELAELKTRDEGGTVTTLSTSAEISDDCDCPFPIIRKKHNYNVGKFVEIRECCLARTAEDGIPRKCMWVKDIPIPELPKGTVLPKELKHRRVSELERRALWAEAKRQKEIEFQKSERERIANIIEIDEPDTGLR